jgi:predicted solute-binding protein
MIKKYMKGMAAAVTGFVDVALVTALDAAANADTWLTATAVAVASVIGTVLVVRLENAKDEITDFGDSVADEF